MFAKCWLLDAIGRHHLSSVFVVEHSHRDTTHPLPSVNPLILFLIRLLKYRDKKNILFRVRALKGISYTGSKIMFLSDFSPEVQKCLACFQVVKKQMQQLGVQYSMLYPTHLRVTYGSSGCSRLAGSPLQYLPRG